MTRILNNKYNKILFLFSLISTMLIGCSNDPVNTASDRMPYTIPDSLMKQIALDTVSTCPLVNAITLTGSVDFDQDHQVNIYPPVSGNIQDVKVQLGDYVQAGQILAVVKSSEMAGYSNNLIIAETNVTNTKKQLDAAKDLYKSGLSSQLDVTTAQVNYDQAIGQLEMVKRVLKINGNNTQGDYVVKSPISGFIVQKNITNNTVIRADNGNNIFTISDLKDVWIQANVYESNINKVHLGDPVQITTLSYPDRDYALKPSMFTSVKVISPGNTEAICVSDKALVFDNSRYYVLKYSGNKKAVITPVDVLSMFGNKVYLKSGVNIGDKVIASQTLLIYDALNN